MPQHEAVIVGIADAPLLDGKFEHSASPLQAQARCAKSALAQAGLDLRGVDGLFTTGMWGVPGVGQHPTVTLAEYLCIRPRYHDGTNAGGAAFVSFLAHAAVAIERGVCDVALITYGSAQRSESSRSLAGRPANLTVQYETPWGLPIPVGGYALAAMRDLHEYRASRKDLAEVAVAARAWAALNPGATKHGPLSIDDVLGAPMICEPLGLLDCCLVTDGGGAAVLTRASHTRKSARPPVSTHTGSIGVCRAWGCWRVRGGRSHRTGRRISAQYERRWAVVHASGYVRAVPRHRGRAPASRRGRAPAAGRKRKDRAGARHRRHPVERRHLHSLDGMRSPVRKPDPIVDPGSAPYWEGLKAGKLLLKWCEACSKAHFYPRELCPRCYSDDFDWKEAKGTGEIYSYTVTHRAAGPAFTDDVPYSIAVVTLDEGPRLLTRILGDRHAVRIGQRVQVSLQSTEGGWVLPFFVVVA